MKPTKPTGRYARITGCWCGYCGSADTVEEIRRRIEQAPEDMRDEVRRHCRTVWRLKSGEFGGGVVTDQAKLVNSDVALAEMHRELDRLYAKHKYVEFHWNTGRQRTLTQNRALHLFCRWLAEALNDAGLDMRAVMRPDVDIPWCTESVKECLWKPVQEATIQKRSTTEADRVEYTKVHEVLCRHLGDRFGVECPPWPKRKDAE